MERVPVGRRKNDPLVRLDHPLRCCDGIAHYEPAERCVLVGCRPLQRALAPDVDAQMHARASIPLLHPIAGLLRAGMNALRARPAYMTATVSILHHSHAVLAGAYTDDMQTSDRICAGHFLLRISDTSKSSGQICAGKREGQLRGIALRILLPVACEQNWIRSCQRFSYQENVGSCPQLQDRAIHGLKCPEAGVSVT